MDGIYGTTRPATINPSVDAEIFYSRKDDRSEVSKESEKFHILNDDFLTNSLINMTDEKNNEKEMKLSGMYNLRLPLDKFGKKGIYTIYIRPKEYTVPITNISVLFQYPDVRGIIFNTKVLPDGMKDLTGYRIEYLDDNGEKTGDSRLITSCGTCEPINTSVDEKVQEEIRYRYVDHSSSLVFCTVTPSVFPSFMPNSKPFIGNSNNNVVLVNTKFDPVMIEIEMVEHDMETISYMLEGSQIRDLDKGKIITFNNNNDIYSCHDYFTLKDKLGEPLYDVKVKKENYSERGDEYKELINE